MQVKVITTLEEFQGISAEWNELLERSLQRQVVFLRSEWLINWWRHFGEGMHLRLYLVRDTQSLLQAVVPLMQIKQSLPLLRRPALAAIFNDHSYMYDVIMTADNSKWRTVCEAFFNKLDQENWSVIKLHAIENNSPYLKIFLEVAEMKSMKSSHSRVFSARPYLSLSGTFTDYFEGLSPSFVKNLNRSERKLMQLGPVELEEFKNIDVTDSVLEEAFIIEQESWKGMAGSAILCDERVKSFYLNFTRIAAEEGWLHLCFLKAGGRRIAFQLNVRYQGVEYSKKIGYRGNYASYSPGKVMDRYLFESLFNDKELRRFEFLGHWNSSARQWNAKSRQIGHLKIYNRSFYSKLLYFAEVTLKHFLKEIRLIRNAHKLAKRSAAAVSQVAIDRLNFRNNPVQSLKGVEENAGGKLP